MARAQVKDEKTSCAATGGEQPGEVGQDRQRGGGQSSPVRRISRRAQRFLSGLVREGPARPRREIGIKGRSSMSKAELVSALRSH
jgi:hypothetical protein